MIFRYLNITFVLILLYPFLANAQLTLKDSSELIVVRLKFAKPIQLSSNISMDDLIQKVKAEMHNPLHAATSIYQWMVVNMEYDYAAKDSEDYVYQNDAATIFKNGRGICSEYVSLFNHFMNELDILSVDVVGYCRNCETSDNDYEVPTHAWNAVFINSSWYMLDVTWDACLSKDNKGKLIGLSNKYFLKTADEMLSDHLPALPMWQMGDSIITVDVFRSSVSNVSLAERHLYNINFTQQIDYYLSSE